MEFSPEIAVLQSAVIFASEKVGSKPSQITDAVGVKSFTDLIVPTIKEIIDGLDQERSNLDRSIWSLKIVSFLLSHILKERLKEQTNQNREKLHVDGKSLASEEMLPVACRKYCKGEEIFQHIPCLSFPIFIEIVTRLKLTQHLLECIEVLDHSTAVSILREIMYIVENSPLDLQQLSLVLSCFKYVAWLACESSKNHVEFDDEFSDLCCTITTWLSKHLHLDLQSSDELSQLQFDFRNIVTLLSQVFMTDSVDPSFKYVITKSHTDSGNQNPERLATGIFQELHGKGKGVESDGSFELFVKCVQKACPKTKWLTIVSKSMKGFDLMNRKDEITIDSSPQGEINVCDSREVTLDLGLTTIDMEDIFKSVLEFFGSQDMTDSDEGLQAMMKFGQTSVDRIFHRRELKRREEDERKGQITLQEKLSKRLSGYEDALEEVISCCDLPTWQSERYAELLSSNVDLLFREQQVQRLHQTLRQLVKAGDSRNNHDATLEAILNILLKKFSRLPILAQERIILENFLKGDNPDLLSHIGNFNQKMNVTFNQSTSDTSGKQVESVLRLCLMSPVAVLERAITAVVKSPGQIAIIIKIFQAVPELCRCCYSNHHPERSLLCHVTCHYLLENILSHNEQKNIIKFVTMATQSFTRDVCGYKLQEVAILSPGEFSTAAVLPFIGLQSGNQPISTEFALKLFISLLERKRDTDFDWLESLQLQTFLLCLCELLHDCAASWDKDHMTTKYGVKQLCLRCFSLLQTNCKGLFAKSHVEAIDWLKSRTKNYDWSVLILLEKSLVKLCDVEESKFTNLVENLAQHVTRNIGTSCLPLLRFVSITDETLQAVMTQIETTKSVISPESMTSALVELLPHLLLSEWRRVVSLILCLVDFDRLSINYRLVFCSVIPLSANYDVKCVLSVTQLLTSVVMVTACNTSAPSAVVHHVATCYTALLQEQIKLIGTLKDRKTEAFLIGQMFSHVTVAMTSLEDDQSETLFVLLLKLLEKFTDLQSTRVLKGKIPASLNQTESEECILKAVTMINDESRQETLLKKLLEQKEKLK